MATARRAAMDNYPTRFVSICCSKSLEDGDTNYYFGFFERPDMNEYLAHQWKLIKKNSEMKSILEGRWHSFYKIEQDEKENKKEKAPKRPRKDPYPKGIHSHF
jgi:hypothetical protein